MEISLILMWTGIPFYFMFQVIDGFMTKYDPLITISNSVLGMIESYCFMLSVLMRLFFIYDPSEQVLICQGVYAMNANIYYAFVIFVLIENKYDFSDWISYGIKVITIMSWMACTIFFILVTTGSAAISLQIGSEEMPQYFYIDVVVTAVVVARFINFLNANIEDNSYRSYNRFFIATLFIASALWMSSVVYEFFMEGPMSILMNLGKFSICLYGLIQSTYLLVKSAKCSRKPSQYAIKNSFDSRIFERLENSIDYLNTS